MSAGVSRIQILTRLCLQSLSTIWQEGICILLLENRSTLIQPHSMFCVVAPGWGTGYALLNDDERETKKDAQETHTLVALLLYKGFSDLSCSRGILTQYLLCLSLLWLRHSGAHIRPLSVYKMNSILASWYHLTVAMVGDLKSTDIWPFPLKGQPLRCHRQRCFPLAHFFPSQLWHSYVDALR